MATAAKKASPKASGTTDVTAALKALEKHASAKYRDGLARYGIVTKDRVLGVSMSDIQKVAKSIGRDHALADRLWRAKIYEARMLAAFVDDPKLVTPAQMDRWAADCDNWATCDTICFKLFDRTPHAFTKVRAWAKEKDEFVKRAAFALIASCAVHRKDIADADFVALLPLIEKGATDDRNFVKKGVSWALRTYKRRPGAKAEAIKLARKLAVSENAAARWIGKDALRDMKVKP